MKISFPSKLARLFRIRLVSKLRRDPGSRLVVVKGCASRIPPGLRCWQVRYKLFFRERVRSSETVRRGKGGGGGSGRIRSGGRGLENGDNSSKPSVEAFDPSPVPPPGWRLSEQTRNKRRLSRENFQEYSLDVAVLSAGPLDRRIYRRRRTPRSCQSFSRSSAGETFAREARSCDSTSTPDRKNIPPRSPANKMSGNKH